MQNKSPPTNGRLRVTFRMWVNQSDRTSHEPFVAISLMAGGAVKCVITLVWVWDECRSDLVHTDHTVGNKVCGYVTRLRRWRWFGCSGFLIYMR